METVIAAALNAASYLVIALLGLYGGRKLVGPNQDKLISTLKDLLEAQDTKIKNLETEARITNDRIASQGRQITELQALTIFQAKEIERLTALIKNGQGV